jgi:N4-gp56 family major capsid protein
MAAPSTPNSTGTLTTELITYLQRVFLERAKNDIVFKEGAMVQDLPANSGKTMSWDRYVPAPSGTPSAKVLTEGVVPAGIQLTQSQITTTVLQYGDFTTITDFLNATGIDKQATEKTEVMSTQMVEIIDNVIRDALFAGSTALFANSRASLSTITATDGLTSKDVLRVRRALKKAATPVYADGRYIGKIGPDTSFDLMQDTTWVNSHVYVDGTPLYNAEVGRLWNVRFIEANANQKSEASTVTVYSNFFHGMGFFGTVDLENMQGGLYIHKGKDETANPLEQYFTIGWKTAFTTTVLNSAWGLNLKTAATV